MHLKLRDQQFKILTHTHTTISKPHRNCKPKIYNKYSHTHIKCYPITTLKTVIKTQEKRAKEDGKKDLQNKS